MKSYEVIVPRGVIKRFYPHPEGYCDGAYVVDLINGMYTDVFYREEGDFITITNDKNLISYLKINKHSNQEILYRNGVFAFRSINDEDEELFKKWQSYKPKIVSSKFKAVKHLPSKLICSFYWIEVGIVTFSEESIIFNVFENDLIADMDIDIALHLLKELIMQK